jgi:hypothetical protein
MHAAPNMMLNPKMEKLRRKAPLKALQFTMLVDL